MFHRMLFLFAGLLAVTVAGRAQESGTRLAFYAVADKEFPDSHLLDTPEFPKVGYITKAPDLQVTVLKKVAANYVPVVLPNLVLRNDKVYRVGVTLNDQDAKAFGDLTEALRGKHLAIFVGDQLIAAPVTRARVDSGHLLLNGRTEKETREIERQLKTLVKP